MVVIATTYQDEIQMLERYNNILQKDERFEASSAARRREEVNR